MAPPNTTGQNAQGHIIASEKRDPSPLSPIDYPLFNQLSANMAKYGEQDTLCNCQPPSIQNQILVTPPQKLEGDDESGDSSGSSSTRISFNITPTTCSNRTNTSEEHHLPRSPWPPVETSQNSFNNQFGSSYTGSEVREWNGSPVPEPMECGIMLDDAAIPDRCSDPIEQNTVIQNFFSNPRDQTNPFLITGGKLYMFDSEASQVDGQSIVSLSTKNAHNPFIGYRSSTTIERDNYQLARPSFYPSPRETHRHFIRPGTPESPTPTPRVRNVFASPKKLVTARRVTNKPISPRLLDSPTLGRPIGFPIPLGDVFSDRNEITNDTDVDAPGSPADERWFQVRSSTVLCNSDPFEDDMDVVDWEEVEIVETRRPETGTSETGTSGSPPELTGEYQSTPESSDSVIFVDDMEVEDLEEGEIVEPTHPEPGTSGSPLELRGGCQSTSASSNSDIFVDDMEVEDLEEGEIVESPPLGSVYKSMTTRRYPMMTMSISTSTSEHRPVEDTGYHYGFYTCDSPLEYSEECMDEAAEL